MSKRESPRESWLRTYREEGDVWKALYPRGYLEFEGLTTLLASAREGMRILEVGIGTGEAALPFLKKGLHVTGIDVSRRALEICDEKFRREGVDPSLYELQPVSVQDYDYPENRLEIVIDYYTSQHSRRTDQDNFYAAASRALVDGGLFLLGQFSAEHLKKQQGVSWHGRGVFYSNGRFFCVSSPEEMAKRLQAVGLNVDSIYNYETRGFYEILAQKP